ncbi:velvet factor-domain-containing protein [Kickxella alabastrina]|uniref:velvet factor-domain-containing protein n=1 Tax=Kickxella alabastrina TaxID=61397 RepID=UPI00221F82AA|nr:velvet factor-domain-containing protein [Kickxella alabastrina]KAI7826808.1 velvet factor-domain-containing protein [Kickxella alabastrina]
MDGFPPPNLAVKPTYVQHPHHGSVQKYELEIAQHPIRARMCGFGEKDRRPLDPPPVVRLRVRDDNGEFMQSEEVDIWRFVVSATLWAPHANSDRSIVINPNTLPGPVPMYQPSSSAQPGGHNRVQCVLAKDEYDVLSIFFIFHDLSVRTEGQFRLKFQFTVIPSEEEPLAFVESVAWSSVFEVYSAKTFPGMTDSTELSRAFATQGIKITIRKNSRGRPYHSRAGGHLEEDGYQDDDDLDNEHDGDMEYGVGVGGYLNYR